MWAMPSTCAAPCTSAAPGADAAPGVAARGVLPRPAATLASIANRPAIAFMRVLELLKRNPISLLLKSATRTRRRECGRARRRLSVDGGGFHQLDTRPVRVVQVDLTLAIHTDLDSDFAAVDA